MDSNEIGSGRISIAQGPKKNTNEEIMVNMEHAVDHRVGKTDDDGLDIPILTKRSRVSLALRTFIILLNIITCFFMILQCNKTLVMTDEEKGYG